MKLLIIRHGESEADILNVHEGRADFPLTERGHSQARAMSEYVHEHYRVEKIYHSTLKRAAQTAVHLADETGAFLYPDEHLLEFNNGLIAGMSYTEADEKYPIQKVPVHAAVYQQESLLDFRYRAEYILSKIIADSDDKSTVAVVTHGGMINQLYRAFFRLPVVCDYVFPTGDTGIHEWLIREKTRVVLKANFIPHHL